MKTAVLALHYQNEVLHPDGRIRLGVAEGASGRGAVIEAASRLLAAARMRALPLLHVRIAFPPGYAGVVQNAPIFRNVVANRAMEEGSWGTAFHDGLGPLPGEPVITHNRVNAFFRSDLEDVLAALHVDRLIMAGVATNSVVEHSARHAADMGFHVAVAADACSAGQPHLHQAALDNIALLGDVSTVAALLEGEA
ncbi:MAG: cysteine hydrolase [Sphingobium sp.]|nr:MAG: cysteine hydrolase [Sphingobium sp.]